MYTEPIKSCSSKSLPNQFHFGLLPLPIRILVKLLVVITVTIVTVVATLLQWLLGDGLGAPALVDGCLPPL